MTYTVIYLDEAREDVKRAKAWYKKQLNGLQKKFATDVIEAIVRMQVTPTAYAIRYKNIRIIHTRIFPFGIHFYIDETNKSLVITAITHDFRDTETVAKGAH